MDRLGSEASTHLEHLLRVHWVRSTNILKKEKKRKFPVVVVRPLSCNRGDTMTSCSVKKEFVMEACVH